MSAGHFEIVVIGAGPAGLRAAQIAASEGARVALIDDNPRPGGQIWRQGPAFAPAAPLQDWLAATRDPAALTLMNGAKVVAAGSRRLSIERADDSVEIGYDALILATGARERLLPFEGWTLPGVTGAGGLQALIKGGMPVAGERIVIAGSGPLLFAAAATAKARGADVLAVVEQSSAARVARFGVSLAATPAKLVQAVTLLGGIGVSRYWTDSMVVAAEGAGRVESVTIRRGATGRTTRLAADRVACGFGLVPNVSLAQALGCVIEADEAGEAGSIRVDGSQRTSVNGVFAAGECTGIGGMERAAAEGALAAYAALNIDDARSSEARRARERWHRFAARVERAFELGDAARAVPSAATLLCRCEDVSVGAVAVHANWRDAKLHTRCGMGACQGRICGAAAQLYFGWDAPAPRPPFSPARIGTLIAAGASCVDSTVEPDAS